MTKQVSSHGDFSPVLSYFILTSKFAKLQILPGLSTEQLWICVGKCFCLTTMVISDGYHFLFSLEAENPWLPEDKHTLPEKTHEEHQL